MHIVRNPEYGKDYDKGYVFFSYNTKSLLAAGIALFTRDEAKNGVPVSHCGIITGENECIESHPDIGGVNYSNFKERFIDPHEIVVFFCKPNELNDHNALVLHNAAASHIGKGYATRGVITSGLWTLFGFASLGWFRKKRNWFNSEQNMFCSELCAEALIEMLPDRPGTLKWHPTNIYPSTLFNDAHVFKPWDANRAAKRKSQGRNIVEVKADF